MQRSGVGLAIGLSLALASLACGQAAPPRAVVADATVGRWVVIDRVGRYGRAPLHSDAVEAQLVAGTWTTPQPGNTLTLPDGAVRTWQEVTATSADRFLPAELRAGYACWVLPVERSRIAVLEARGPALVYVNGAPQVGDPYANGIVRIPVQLAAGENTLLFALGRDDFSVRLVEALPVAEFNSADPTYPDLVPGRERSVWAALPVLNNTSETLRGLVLEVTSERGVQLRSELPPIAPLTMRKVGFRVPGWPDDPAPPDKTALQLRLLAADGAELDTLAIELGVRAETTRHKCTFISDIDGSVQYFSVVPPETPPPPDQRSALFLSLHGASVEATNQAAAYAPKDWGYVVVPTNRRPFGFDWEDWGRADAVEVLAVAEARWSIDPARVYLTGHSMGGHGVWQIGATLPDRFAAIGPSAGWPDFWSYAGGATYENPTDCERLLDRAANGSRTLSLKRNYLHYGIYVLHGDQDDNVPIDLARKMRAELSAFHPDFAYHEQPGAGHWWGNACVDWPEMFAFFQSRTRPATSDVRRVEFRTVNPGVSAVSRWITIAQQLHPLEVSSVALDLNPAERRFSGTTDNVRRLQIDLHALVGPRPRKTEAGETAEPVLAPDLPLQVTLDGDTPLDVPWPTRDLAVWLERDAMAWHVGTVPPAAEKGPQRNGPFKEAFAHRFVLVYGTAGDPAENAAAYDKARYDAQVFWYRGNGAPDLVSDRDFAALAPADTADRSVILYGNADTNRAWAALLGSSPVQVIRGGVSVGTHKFAGDQFACLFVRPRPGSDTALVAAVAGSGVPGLKLAQRMPYFLSGVGFPDCLVIGPESLCARAASSQPTTSESQPTGLRVAGYFGADWGIESGEFAFGD